jgi:ATP-dependent DNA helicase RecG
MLADLELPSLLDALTMMHRPPRDAHLGELLSGHHPAQRRLSFEELLAHQLSLRLLRQEIRSDPAWPLADRADSSAASSSRCRSRSPARRRGHSRTWIAISPPRSRW